MGGQLQPTNGLGETASPMPWLPPRSPLGLFVWKAFGAYHRGLRMLPSPNLRFPLWPTCTPHLHSPPLARTCSAHPTRLGASGTSGSEDPGAGISAVCPCSPQPRRTSTPRSRQVRSPGHSMHCVPVALSSTASKHVLPLPLLLRLFLLKHATLSLPVQPVVPQEDDPLSVPPAVPVLPDECAVGAHVSRRLLPRRFA